MQRVNCAVGWAAGVLAGLLVACGGDGTSSTMGEPGGGGGGGGSGGSKAGSAGSAPGTAGKGGGGSAGSGGGGGSGGTFERVEGPAQWFVYDSPDGIFAYDMLNYPNPAAKIRLGEPPGAHYGATSGPHFSPDGKYLLAISAHNLTVWDMSGNTPSEGVIVVADVMPNSYGSMSMWGADSKTLIFEQDKSLFALDGTTAMAEQHVISDKTPLLYQVAPQGDGLIFDDATGMNFVHVKAGVPGTPEPVDVLGADWRWARDGVHFGTCGASVKLFDASSATLKMTDVYPLTRTYASSPSFSPDGKYFGFQSGSGNDTLMYGSMATPTVVKALLGPVEGAEGRASVWHPTKSFIAYNVAHPPSYDRTTEWLVADVSGAEPPVPTVVPVSGDFERWLPDGTKLMMTNAEHKQLSIVDMDAKPPSVTPFLPQELVIYQSWISPDGSTLAFATPGALSLVGMEAPSTKPVVVEPGGQADAVPYAVWSADGRYILIDTYTEQHTKASVKLARIDGTQVTELITIMEPTSNQGFSWTWQATRTQK